MYSLYINGLVDQIQAVYVSNVYVSTLVWVYVWCIFTHWEQTSQLIHGYPMSTRFMLYILACIYECELDSTLKAN